MPQNWLNSVVWTFRKPLTGSSVRPLTLGLLNELLSKYSNAICKPLCYPIRFPSILELAGELTPSTVGPQVLTFANSGRPIEGDSLREFCCFDILSCHLFIPAMQLDLERSDDAKKMENRLEIAHNTRKIRHGAGQSLQRKQRSG